MCWSTYHYKNTQPLIAETDIKVLKFFISNEMGLTSPYYNYSYTIGVLCPKVKLICYGASLLLDTYCAGTIFDGYHSYQDEQCSILCDIDCDDNATLILDYEDHIIRKFNGPINDPKYTLYECVIPKGTKYYVNEHHEIVSETIIVKKPAKYKRYTPLKKTLITLLSKHFPWVKINKTIF